MPINPYLLFFIAVIVFMIIIESKIIQKILKFFTKKEYHPNTTEWKAHKKARPLAEKCHICQRKINSITGFFCEYCNQWHCEKHRLPEDHKCKGKPKALAKEKGMPIRY